MSESKQKKTKLDFEHLQTLLKNQHDLEDRKANIFNERWKLNNENLKKGQQLRLVQDQIRNMFGRFRIEEKKNKE